MAKRSVSKGTENETGKTGSLFESPVGASQERLSLSEANPAVVAEKPILESERIGPVTQLSGEPAIKKRVRRVAVVVAQGKVEASKKRGVGLPAVVVLADERGGIWSDVAAELLPEAADYVIQTSQEVDALMRAASDGQHGNNWVTDPNAATRSHIVPGAPHHVQLALSEDERASDVPLKALEELTLAQDPDFNFALLYISQVLAPPSPLPSNLAAVEWVDLDDVMDKIGWSPRSSQERLEMRRRVWKFLLFGARASIVGQRTGEYVNKATGQRIETVIDAPPWAVMEREKPTQPQLFAEIRETPLRVRLVASQAWTRLTTLPETAQYLPMGELLGSIPGNKPSGAWARVLGLALANFWRRAPHAALDGTLKPTRLELLDRYTPKVAPPHEILCGKNPVRAVEYWQGALKILVDCGFLMPQGEAALSYREMRAQMPRQEWQQQWLSQTVELHPGPRMRPAVEGCAHALPESKPRVLNKPKPKRKRGRPRKENTEKTSQPN